MTTFAPRPSSMPTTPKSPGPSSSYMGGGGGGSGFGSRTTTPRSSRRVMTSTTTSSHNNNSVTPSRTPSRPALSHASLPPLPILSHRVYPSVPYADDAQLLSLLDADREAIDFTVSMMRDKTSERKKEVAEALAEIEEEKRRVDQAARSLGEAAREIQKTMQREREEAEEARVLEAEASQAGRTWKAQVDAVRSDIAEIEVKLAARRELKAKHREAFARQASRNAPEIVFFEQKLGLKIHGRGRDIVEFKFCSVDAGSHNRIFTFNVDASKPNYSISALSPKHFLPSSVTEPLLTALNKSRDFYTFVIAMRNAFKDEVLLERMIFPNGADGERERENERQRLRDERAKRKSS